MSRGPLDVLVELRQNVRLTGRIGVTSPSAEGAFMVVATWRVNGVGTVSATNVRQVREDLQDFVDEFVNDWLAVH